MDILEKQAVWFEQRPLFEAEFIHSHLLPSFNFNENTGDYEIKSQCLNNIDDVDRKVGYETLNTGWVMWLRAKCDAKAQAVPEGFVLVPKENISCFWQDNDEPENFCNSSNDWDCLGDGIEKDQIMIVNKHTQAHISTEKFFGVWKLIETSYGTRWKFELFKSEFEAKQAMIEAQEPAND